MMPTPTPKYFQLHDIIRQAILNGEYPIGSQLPTEAILCERYNVSRGTVRKAFDLLEQSGLISREQGRGVFIKERAILNGRLSLIDAVVMQTRTLQQSVLPAPDEIAHRLRLAVGEAVIVIEQVGSVDGLPIIYEKRWLAQKLCPDLLHDNLDSMPIHSRLLDVYQIVLVKMSLTVEVIQLPLDATQVLHLPTGSMGFKVERLTYTQDAQGEVIPAVWYRGYSSQANYQLQAAFQASL